MLGRLEMTVDECIKEYEGLMGKIFGTKSPWVPIALTTGRIPTRYDVQILKKEIEKILENGERGLDGTTLLNDGEERRCRVYVWTFHLQYHCSMLICQ